MHFPMSRIEVSTYLRVEETEVERLWKTGALARSVDHPLRVIQELASSSPFDVLEFALSSGHLTITLSVEQSALWITELAELMEYERASTGSRNSLIDSLMHAAQFEGIPKSIHNCEIVANVVVDEYFRITDFCNARDYSHAG